MVDPIVRAAGAGDADQLAALERAARTALLEQRGGRRWLETHPERGTRWLDAIESGHVYVAAIDDTVVGYLVASHVPSEGGTILRIDEVYVEGDARELGFGDALLAAAIDDGRAAGCVLVEGEALPGDRDIKNLYERAGITARLIIVSKAL